MGPTSFVMQHPCLYDALQVVLGKRDYKIETFPPQRADEPLAERIGLRSPHRRLEHLQPQVAYALVKLLREDAIAVMYQKSVGMVSGNGFAQLLQGPRRCRMRRDIGMQDAARGMFHDDEHVEEAKGGCDHHTEITGHNGLGMIAHKGLPALGRRTFPSPRVQARGQIRAYGTR